MRRETVIADALQKHSIANDLCRSLTLVYAGRCSWLFIFGQSGIFDAGYPGKSGVLENVPLSVVGRTCYSNVIEMASVSPSNVSVPSPVRSPTTNPSK